MYQKPLGSNQAEIVIKRSRFLANAYPVETRTEAMAIVQQIRARYPEANHHCWAYILGDPAGTCSAASDDDGEPGGTAGKPILNVLQHKKVGDVLLIVTRFFGGVKLGAGGLVRAYSAAAEATMKTLQCVEEEPVVAFKVSLEFSEESIMRHWLAQNSGTLQDIQYSDGLFATVVIHQRLVSHWQQFIAGLKGQTSCINSEN